MLWIKAFHILTIITWFAALFYLPRLFVYHAMSSDEISIERFKVMERKLYRGIMMPSFVIAIFMGVWLSYGKWDMYISLLWFQLKLVLVTILIAYHFYCGYLVRVFAEDKNIRSHAFYRWFNEFPVLLLVGIIILVVVQPFQ
jgi:putative membrane protein